ncbi:MAG: radical SAM family heme chaperone HemW [Oligoflexales bacterium]|nr:radical SAM family heme chaperone HemW [Oligoflexales bacterium]
MSGQRVKSQVVPLVEQEEGLKISKVEVGPRQKAPGYGLYIHIPFCSFMCHYCDFAKTALWDNELVSRYLQTLVQHLRTYLDLYPGQDQAPILSVFLGGGTPGLFSREYEELFNTLRRYTDLNGLEITLEANPGDISEEKLQVWRELGINRLSVGIQSFQAAGLRYLTRDHSPELIREKLALVKKHFDNFSLDLIFGWGEQTLELWHQDLLETIACAPKHISCYKLTYSSTTTPLGRAFHRGKIQEQEEELLCRYYEAAQKVLAGAGYHHDEVSNWSKPGFASQHNHLYWQDQYYIGLGLGACGYLPSSEKIGQRYEYTRSFIQFLDSPLLPPLFEGKSLLLKKEERTDESWLIEYLSSGIRCKAGVDLERIRKKLNLSFTPRSTVLWGLEQGLLASDGKRLTLSSEEWFKEGAWSLLLLECFA